ncbi:PQQ-binding-like beta-propeller repeat protein [Haloarcula sp. H-GB4]|uniref:PQQ-binding-like beta-propeller repeat protein n=1 Tax=Haloarcula sp. H-GB4 TaxID=3069755 RepID=UPI0027AE4785|nr:PQQ-binding-like beta-propeller repeat protein [Haloarcula sp. H-GB4]MDQ2072408.1 PQQ-binding-like beta-propeller repeat protein [Haloarcula sp. H-GB4]
MKSRRTFLVAFGAALTGCAGPGGSQTEIPQSTSPTGTTRQSDPATETATDPRTASEKRPDPPEGDAVRWVYQTNGPMAGQWAQYGTNRPVVRDGTVYAVGGSNDRGTPPQERMQPPRSQNVYAVGTDGTQQWRYAANKSVPVVTPAANGVYAIVGWNTRMLGIGQQLVRIENGELQWGTEPRDTYLSVLGTTDGTAIVSTHDDEISRNGESLFAVTADSGRRFERETGDIRKAVVQNGTVYASEGPDRTSAFDTTDGTRRWSYPGRLLGDPPAHYGDSLYVSEETDSGEPALAAIDESTGDSSWQYQARNVTEDGFNVTGAAERDGTVYATEFGGLLVALQSADGTEQWRYPTANDTRGPPVIANDTVCVPIGKTTVHAVDLSTGERIWSHSFKRPLREMQTASDAVVCWTQGDDAAGVHALSFDGDPMWRVIIQGTTTAPTVTESGTYIGTRSGYILKLGE